MVTAASRVRQTRREIAVVHWFRAPGCANVPANMTHHRPSIPVYLVRHGVTPWNATGLVQGWTDIPLSDTGRAQAERVASALAGVRFSAVLTSTLSRARETAEIAARPHGLELQIDADLREYHCGEWEGRPYQEIRATEHARFFAWFNDPDVAMPGGESMRQSGRRAAGAVRRALDRLEEERARQRRAAGASAPRQSYTHPGEGAEALLVVAHGGVNRLIAADLLGLEIDVAKRMRLDNAAICVFEPFLGAYALKLWNSTAHLDGLSGEGEGDTASRIG